MAPAREIQTLTENYKDGRAEYELQEGVVARLLDVAEDPRNATERTKTSLEHAVHVLSERYDELYATLRELKRKEKDEETRELYEKKPAHSQR